MQSDANVKKISQHITKQKVAGQAAGTLQKDRKDFEKKWDDIKIKYGMISDEKFL